MNRRSFITSAGVGLLASLSALPAISVAAESQLRRARPPSRLSGIGTAAARSIESSAQTFIKKGYGPGMSVAAVRAGSLIYAQGFGLANLEANAPVTPATVFRAGSITKQFVAAAIMRLVEDGKLDLDAPAAKYIPALKPAGPITVRRLLSQTSGLHDYTESRDFSQHERLNFTSQQMLDYILSQPKLNDFRPGDRFEYSNSNYFVLGVIVERVSGRPLRDALGDLFHAAGLRETAVDRDNDVVPHRASGYALADNHPGEYQRAAFFSMDAAGGAGAIRSTPSDLAKWQQALFAGKIVSPASLTQMLTPGVLNDGREIVRDSAPIALGKPGYGFGLEIGTFEGLRAIGHGGAVNGFTAYVVTYPKLALSMSIMVNISPNKYVPLPFQEIQRAMIAAV
ncbi:MAG: serine hydrolase domain-containing protein [Rhodanobacter sp.]